MICTKTGCGGKLRVTHTYSLASAKFQRAECERCKRPHTLQTLAEATAGRGTGAKARARQAAKRAQPEV